MAQNDEVKYCKHCGEQIHSTADLCPFCGKSTVSQGPTVKKVKTAPVSPPKRRLPLKIIGLLVVVFLAGSLFGYLVAPKAQVESSPTMVITSTNGVESPTNATENWVTVRIFYGTEPTTTEKFHISKDVWRIKYSVEAENTHPGFAITIAPSGQIITYDQSGTEVSYVYDGPGDYYLDIWAVGLDSWTIEIQVQQ